MRRYLSPTRRPLLALLVFAVVTTGTALAAPRRAGGTATPQQQANQTKPTPRPTRTPKAKNLAEEGQPTEPAAPAPATSTLARELESSGQVDPVAGLGIRNPVCDALAEIRDRATRTSCAANGSPESNYPTSNYGFDVFIPTGITHPIGDFTAGFVTVLGGIWLGLIFVLKLILELLGLAFSLNPFAEGPTMGRISAAVGRIYTEVTDPWLSTLVVCGGVWLAHRGLIRRDLAGGLAGTIAAIAMLVLGLWVVHQPRESVGRLAASANQVALGTISAPQSGSLERPGGSYAEAMSRTWSQLVEVPFAGLDFSDVHWALGPPPPEAVKRADASFCDDVGALAYFAVLARYGSRHAQEECGRIARRRYGRPRRVIDLYLRSSPGSPAREALWNYFNGNDEYKAKVAAQGGDGALTRLSMLALFALGLLGAILLLAWLALRLFTQAAIAFVLLLAAPFALFLPLLGDAGRRAFRTWGLTLLGSLLAKVIYAAFLSIILLGIGILARVEGPAGSATGFLLSAAFAWAVFLKRADLIGWLRIGDAERHATLRGGFAAATALGLARRGTRSGAHGARSLAARGHAQLRSRRALGAEATRRTAHESLMASAGALADHRHREAAQVVAAYEAANGITARGSASRRTGSAADGPPRSKPPGTPEPTATPQSRSAGNPLATSASPEPAPSEERYRDAKRVLRDAERSRRRGGEQWGEHDLQRFAAEDRALLSASRDPADHAHRAGFSRAEFESLRGDARERAREQIERARKRDLRRLAVSDDPPGRVVPRARLTAERISQSLEGQAKDRRAQLAALRRERRSRPHLQARRNLSRGA